MRGGMENNTTKPEELRFPVQYCFEQPAGDPSPSGQQLTGLPFRYAIYASEGTGWQPELRYGCTARPLTWWRQQSLVDLVHSHVGRSSLDEYYVRQLHALINFAAELHEVFQLRARVSWTGGEEGAPLGWQADAPAPEGEDGVRVYDIRSISRRRLWLCRTTSLVRALEDAVLNEAHLAGADLAGANLVDADLEGANLAGANLEGADLKGANLTGASLVGASLAGANLAGANLAGANLADADLADADLADADLKGADLKGADLVGAAIEAARNLRLTPEPTT